MATKPKFSEAETLEQYRIALDNAESQAEIAAIIILAGLFTDRNGTKFLCNTKCISKCTESHFANYMGKCLPAVSIMAGRFRFIVIIFHSSFIRRNMNFNRYK